jgi:PKD domain-containing protein
LRRNRKLIVPAAIAAVVISLVAAGCGGDDDKKSAEFKVKGNADKFAGPTPLSSHFTASASGGKGDVLYRWRFDDGTTSTEQNPAHNFPRPGYYQVILDARDSEGNSGRQTLLLGAWPPKQWADAQVKPFTKESAAAAQKVQQKRTDKRRAELRAKIRREAAQAAAGTQ